MTGENKMREALKASECLYAWALSPNSQPIEKIVEKFQIVRKALTQQPESEPIGEIGLDPNGILEPQIYSDFDITTLEVGAEIYTSPQPSARPAGYIGSRELKKLQEHGVARIFASSEGLRNEVPFYLHAQPSAQVEAAAVERFWDYLQDQGVVSKTAPSMVYDEYMLALQDCDPVDDVDSCGLWPPRVRQAIKDAFIAGREAGHAAQVPHPDIGNLTVEQRPNGSAVIKAGGTVIAQTYCRDGNAAYNEQFADCLHIAQRLAHCSNLHTSCHAAGSIAEKGE